MNRKILKQEKELKSLAGIAVTTEAEAASVKFQEQNLGKMVKNF